MKGPMSKKTKESPKKKPQKEHQVLGPTSLTRSISNKEREDLLKRHLA